MSILEIKDELFQIEKAWCDEALLNITLKGGLSLQTPLSWYENLKKASVDERNNIRVLPFGDALHWPDLDEDLSVKGILRYAASREMEAAE